VAPSSAPRPMHHHVRGRLWETCRLLPLGLAGVWRFAGAFGHVPLCRPPPGDDPPTAGARWGSLPVLHPDNCATNVGELIWIRLDLTRLPLLRWRQPSPLHERPHSSAPRCQGVTV
jgi:hypothetical protein